MNHEAVKQPPAGKKIEDGKIVNQVSILYQAQVAEKYGF